jgi:RNA polymerase sigma-70 factor (ECF subfamily)
LKELDHIEQVLKGNLHAFEALINAHKTMVFSIALRFAKNEQDAEELTQDVFLRAYENLASFKGHSKFSTWLYKIAFNWCVNKTRTKRIYEPVTYQEHHMKMDTSLNGLELLEREERAALVQKALSELNETDSIVLILFYFEELSIAEIAETLSFSQANIKVKLLRARQRILELIENKYQEI